MLHHIQKAILDTLASTPTSRYSQIKPDTLDGNVFSYHLKQLITNKYIERTTDGSYQLRRSGRDYIVHRNEDTTLTAHTIFLLVIKAGDQYLIRRRSVQPLIAYSGFVHGEPIAGEDLVVTAKRRLHEKTNLDIELYVKGSALISHYIDSELHSYSHAIILYGAAETTTIASGDTTGQNSWRSDLRAFDIFPSCNDIAAMIDAHQTWRDLRYDLKSLIA